MPTCPGCDSPMRRGFFLCNPCAAATPDELIVRIGSALDAGDDEAANTAISEAVDLIRRR